MEAENTTISRREVRLRPRVADAVNRFYSEDRGFLGRVRDAAMAIPGLIFRPANMLKADALARQGVTLKKGYSKYSFDEPTYEQYLLSKYSISLGFLASFAISATALAYIYDLLPSISRGYFQSVGKIRSYTLASAMMLSAVPLTIMLGSYLKDGDIQ